MRCLHGRAAARAGGGEVQARQLRAKLGVRQRPPRPLRREPPARTALGWGGGAAEQEAYGAQGGEGCGAGALAQRQALQAAEQLAAAGMKPLGIMSHFACADDATDSVSEKQLLFYLTFCLQRR